MGFRMWSWLAIFAPPELPVRGVAGHPWLDAYSAASRGRAATIPPRVLRSPACVPSLLGVKATVAGGSPPERANFIRGGQRLVKVEAQRHLGVSVSPPGTKRTYHPR